MTMPDMLQKSHSCGNWQNSKAKGYKKITKIGVICETADGTLFFSRIKNFFQKPLDKIRKMVYYVDSALMNAAACCCVRKEKEA